MSGAGTASRDTWLPEGAHPLLRLLTLARPVRGRLLLAVLAAAAATGCGVALLGTSNANPYIGAWTKTLGDRGILLVPLTTAMLKSKSS